jgi:hypothetical protein
MAELFSTFRVFDVDTRAARQPSAVSSSFMWPEAVQAVKPESWRAPDDHLGKRVGLLKDAKEELGRRVVPKNLKPEKRKSFPHYRESDSPEIARHVREKKLARNPGAKSDSYSRFLSSVDQCEVA